jgi:hypothetical protein
VAPLPLPSLPPLLPSPLPQLVCPSPLPCVPLPTPTPNPQPTPSPSPSPGCTSIVGGVTQQLPLPLPSAVGALLGLP